MKFQPRQYLNKIVKKYKSLSPLIRMRIGGGVAIVALMAVGLYATNQIFGAANDVTGFVFRDYNGNGKRDNPLASNPSLAADRGVAGITVKAFGTDGALCDTQTSAADGSYTLQLSGCMGTKFRVEYSNLPAGYNSTQVGVDSKTTTQFVAAGGVSSLGIYQPGDYSQNTPQLVTSIMNAGAYNSDNSANKAVVGFPYNTTGTAQPSMILGTHGQTGATWGETYRQSTKTVYSAAFMKRHVGVGSGGTGAVYVSQVPASGTGTTAASLAVTIPNSGGDSHPIADNNCNSIDGQSSTAAKECWAHDQFTFDSPGKRSLGGTALYPSWNNPANDALLVVNLNDRQVYKVTNLNNAPTPTAYAMPLALPNAGAQALPAGAGSGQHQGCALADVRPFAVTVHDGTGYAGFVCSAQTTRATSNLRAYIYSFNPATMVFATAPMMEFPLDYGRSCSNGSAAEGGCMMRASWIPWISNFSDSLVNDDMPIISSGEKVLNAPQPMLTDISFGNNGSMTIGLRDRYGDQMGYRALSTNVNDTQLYSAVSAGDILRACLVNGTYTLESGGKCDGKGPGSAGVHAVVSGLPQGPGGYEFYNYEFFEGDDGKPVRHDEIGMGSLAQVPGFDDFAASSSTVLKGFEAGAWSGGLRWYNSEDGTKTNAYRLYQSSPTVTDYLGKANGIGDVDYVNEPAPIEIGNRVWKDSNGDGVQGPSEPGIAGITVNLQNNTGTVIATAVTDADGNYLFSSRVRDENGQAMTSTADKRYALAGLTANTADYKLVLGTAADYADASRLQGLNLTTANSTANQGNDQNDSDAVKSDPAAKLSASNPAIIVVSTGTPGANDHTNDFGFNLTASIGNFVWSDDNKDGRVNGTEATQGINGVTVNLYAATADADNNGELSTGELMAAPILATQITANDVRLGATNGRPGYYQFDGLAAGNYFVAIDSANFAAGKPLQYLTNVPIPSGVGDTQDDNANHGSVPTGGILASSGVVSTRINLQPGSEPTSASSKPDDDTSNDTDLTIDFGFWHSYGIGNRVWLDKNNSATIDAADGAAPGIKGVTVRLLNSAGTTEVDTTTTDNTGYYRFDNINAGTYIVEIAASNFANGKALHDYNVSSIAAGEEADPDADIDSNDNGINPSGAGQAVRSGTVTVGPGASEPTGEADLGAGGQNNGDAFANMTVDFGFLGTTSFGDTVYYDTNGDASQDTDEPGIPNVTVTLVCAGADGNLATAGDNVTQSMKTDVNGNYLFTELRPGACKATVTTSDVPGANLTTPGSFTHTMTDESFLDADFGFQANGTIGNQVWKETFKNGVYDLSEGDLPVAGVNIELYRDMNGDGMVDNADVLFGTKTTDAAGRYQFTHLPVDDNLGTNGAGAQYVIRLLDPNHKLENLQLSVGPTPGADNNSQTPAGYGMVLTPAAISNQTGDFGYHGLATVGDTVYYDEDNSGTQQPSESVLPGITVTLTYPGLDGDCTTVADNETRSMVTDANGNYLFTDLLGGKYCLSIQPPAGTTITTNNQGEQFTLGPTQTDLTRDFGVIGDGTIGNQVFIDQNVNGRFDGGDTGIADVTLDLYRDSNANGVADAGEPVVKTATTDTNGQYMFTQLVTGGTDGMHYVVVVTDTGNKLTSLTHVLGNGLADNESKPPTGYGLPLTPTDNHRLEADFGYKVNPAIVTPPKFWKQQTVDRTELIYTLTWINQSAVNGVATNFTDGIPDETAYVANSLSCDAQGTSTTEACVFNPTLNRIEWQGKVGADLGHLTAASADNEIVVTYRVALDTQALKIYNQGFGRYDTLTGADVPSDWVDTPELDDPTVYERTPQNAAIQEVTGGLLANTGQLIVAAVVAAGILITFSVGFVVWSRYNLRLRH
jgi:hypothetical protein